jgi:collagen type I/II/III/V/XI/XXIV/XXVII alpha
MTVIVTSGSTLDVIPPGLTITSDSTVAAGGLLEGSSTIAGAFSLVNFGTISANVASTVLNIATGGLTNQGTIVANNGTLIVQASVADTSFVGSTLTGAWQASGAGAIELLSGQVVTDNGIITLDGAASVFDGFNAGTLQPIENSLTMIGASGGLNLNAGRNFLDTTTLTVNGTLTIAGGTLAAPQGILVGAGGVVSGFGTMDAGSPVQDNGTIVAANGTLVLPGAGSVLGLGVLQTNAGASMDLQAFGAYAEGIVNNGTIDAVFAGITGTLGFSGPYSGTGGFLIEGGGGSGTTILELPGTISGNVAFDANSGGQLLLDAPSTFAGKVTGFGNGQTIVLGSLGNAQKATLTGNKLNLTNGGGGTIDTLTLDIGSLDYSTAVFSVKENVQNTQATLTVTGVQPAACFAAGTRIKTLTGEVLVEHLAVGDVIRTHFAGTAPMVWLGHRNVNCRRHPTPSQVWPVLVSAHAFGPRMPCRDLLLSPDHAVFVDDVLIPIKHLINGKSIVQQEVDEVTYYHVELSEHDVLLAEGMPAESYLENGDRAAFENSGGLIAMHPDFGMQRWEAFGCAPLVVAGPKLTAVAERVRGRLPKPRFTASKMFQAA